MPLNWKSLCNDASFKIVDDKVQVMLENDRQHHVKVEVSEDQIYLYSVVARPAAVTQFENAALRAWQRNRALTLVSFRVDERGRMVGESWIPTAGLQRDEFQLHIRTMAIECDRFEFQITGRDLE